MRSFFGFVAGLGLAMSLLASPASADEVPPPPTVAFAKSSVRGVVSVPIKVTGTYAGVEGPVSVVLRRIKDGRWVNAAEKVTASGGRFSVTVRPTVTAQKLQAVLVDGTGTSVARSASAALSGAAARSTLTVTVPTTVVDYQPVTLRTRWRTQDGRKPDGYVRLQVKVDGTTSYSSVGTIRIRNGSGWKTFRPRLDGSYRVVFAGSPYYRAVNARSRHIDNLPPGKVVRLPEGAARPTYSVPPQRRAARARADVTVGRLSDRVWSSMTGRSWHRGCPVGRSSLRIVRVSYWGFDGYVHRGEIVVHRDVATATAKTFVDLFEHRTPIRSMYRVDRFGWSESLKGANDLKSMRADNTSGFNCRQQVGWIRYRSPHAWGRSIDINTWENPFASHSGYRPNAEWAKRTKPTSITWRGHDDPVVTIFRKHGFRWLGKADLQHFQH